MTRLERKVRRAVGDGRDAYVVILHPADGSMEASVEIRERGRRAGYRIGLGRLYTRLALLAVEQGARNMRLRVALKKR